MFDNLLISVHGSPIREFTSLEHILGTLQRIIDTTQVSMQWGIFNRIIIRALIGNIITIMNKRMGSDEWIKKERKKERKKKERRMEIFIKKERKKNE